MTIYPLTESTIRSRVGEKSFSRGKQYYKNGAISSPWIQGDVVKAKCWGSSPHPYRVWVRLEPDGIEESECSCPVGAGGYCKHVAALLLTWLHESESFQTVEPLENALGQRDEADLILLIQKMIARYPDLEEMVYVTPVGAASATTLVNPDLIRRQVEQAIKHGDYGHAYYGAAGSIADELDTIMMQVDVYREQDSWSNAAVIYCTVLDELLSQRPHIYDHDGDLHAVFWDGSERLGECLEHIHQAEERLEILRTLVNIVVDDIKVGGYGFADAAHDIVLMQSKPAEKVEMVIWVEDELARISSSDDFSTKWRVEAFGRLLLNLQSDSLTDEQLIQLSRRTGQLNVLVERLLQLGRVDEAVSDTQTASDYELLAVADLFVAHDHPTIAEKLVEERAEASNDTRLDNWLKNQAVNSGDWHKAVGHAEKKFSQRPSVENYQDVKQIASKLGDWPERKEMILSQLTQKEEYTLLTQIYLIEKEVEAALATLPKVRFARDLDMKVAAVAEETHPREAIQLYRQQIERLIAGRGRGNYAEAAGYLLQVKKLYQRLSEVDTWQQYIQAIRVQKPRLPALLDELKQAGL